MTWSWSTPENQSPGCQRCDSDAAAVADAADGGGGADANWQMETKFV